MCTGYGPRYYSLTRVSYFTCSARLPGPHRAGVPGRLAPVGSNCASQRRAISRGTVHPRSETWVGVGSKRRSTLARPSGQRDGPELEASDVSLWPGLPVGEAGRSRKRVLFLFGQAFRLERRARVGIETFRFERRAKVKSGRRSSFGQAFRSETRSPFWRVC